MRARRGGFGRLAARAAGIAASVVIVLWGAATVAFLALRVIPGDPVEVMLGPQAQVSDEVKDAIRSELGLDRPPLEEYVAYLGQLLRGDLGESSVIFSTSSHSSVWRRRSSVGRNTTATAY